MTQVDRQTAPCTHLRCGLRHEAWVPAGQGTCLLQHLGLDVTTILQLAVVHELLQQQRA
jgi:hypothetical protein